MLREKNDISKRLIFRPKGWPMSIVAECVNHGLVLPLGKTLLEIGLFTLGELITDKGNAIEAALRKVGSFGIYLVARDAQNVKNPLPIMLFPNLEYNDEIIVPDDFFNSYYNCHGFTFADREYWINPLASELNSSGQMVLSKPNIEVLLEDEYEEVGMKDEWVVAVFYDSTGKIAHSVKREYGQIFSKYDGYQLMNHRVIDDVDIGRYGNGKFKYYRKSK